MADVTRYINTGSTAGGDGTTNATAGANRAYATFSEWEAAEDGASSATDNHIVYVTGLDDLGASNILTSGWASGAVLNLVANTGQECECLGTQGAGITTTNTTRAIGFYQEHHITGLRIIGATRSIQYLTGSYDQAHTYNYCFLDGQIQGSTSDGGGMLINNSVLLEGGAANAIQCGTTATDYPIEIYCSVVDGRILTSTNKTVTLKNSSFLDSSDWIIAGTGATVAGTSCLIAETSGISDLDTDGGGNHDGQSFTGYFVGAPDYNITASATNAINGGLGTTDSDIPATDCNGVSRDSGSSDIGIAEYVSAGGGATIPIFYRHYQQMR